MARPGSIAEIATAFKGSKQFDLLRTDKLDTLFSSSHEVNQTDFFAHVEWLSNQDTLAEALGVRKIIRLGGVSRTVSSIRKNAVSYDRF